MTAEWYYAKNKQKVGPVTTAQLKELMRSGELAPKDMVWKQGMAKWTEAGHVAELAEDVYTAEESTPPPLPATLSQPSSTDRSAETAPQNPLRHLWDHKLPVIAAALSVFLFLSLCCTCLVPGLFGTETKEDFFGPRETPTTMNRLAQGFFCFTSVTLFIPLTVIGIVWFARFVKRDNLYGRWNPVEGNYPWIEFVRGGNLTRSDGYTASFRFNKNNTIDVWQEDKAGKTWKVISLGTHELVIQDQHGKLRRYKKGKTLEEKQANPFHRLFHKERGDDLPGTWMPIDGSGKWVQFTKDGAAVFSDGGAGRYTVTGEEPNEIIRVTMADGSAREFRVMSISPAQLVIVEGSEARTYARHGTKTTAVSPTSSEQAQVPSEDPPTDQGTSGGGSGFWAGVGNWLTPVNGATGTCPKCKSKQTEELTRTVIDRRQEVKTDWNAASGTHKPQAVFNITTYESECRCKKCGEEWIQQHTDGNRA